MLRIRSLFYINDGGNAGCLSDKYDLIGFHDKNALDLNLAPGKCTRF